MELATVFFVNYYQRFLEKSGETEAPSNLRFGDETKFKAFELPSMIWAKCEFM